MEYGVSEEVSPGWASLEDNGTRYHALILYIILQLVFDLKDF